MSGKYLNDSQCKSVKPVEVRNVYDFPFGAKKIRLTSRSIDASENKLKTVLLRSLGCPSCVFDSRDITLWALPGSLPAVSTRMPLCPGPADRATVTPGPHRARAGGIPVQSWPLPGRRRPGRPLHHHDDLETPESSSFDMVYIPGIYLVYTISLPKPGIY